MIILNYFSTIKQVKYKFVLHDGHKLNQASKLSYINWRLIWKIFKIEIHPEVAFNDAFTFHPCLKLRDNCLPCGIPEFFGTNFLAELTNFTPFSNAQNCNLC